MIKEILTYPNSILRKKSADVLVFDEKIHALLEDMKETMNDKGGVGLAAVQIGELLNVLIINIPVEDKSDLSGETDIQLEENLIEAINPKITFKDGEQTYNEGCLSIPNYYDEITRSLDITVEYKNRFGELQILDASGFLAVAWQHEIEHLEGHVFIENLSFLKRKKFEKDWKRKIKEELKKGKI
jgi:peptide deformylase